MTEAWSPKGVGYSVNIIIQPSPGSIALGSAMGCAYFHIKPKTGKTHQIRVALKSLGSPILGDALYGAALADRVYLLHSARLSFEYAGQSWIFSALPQQGSRFDSVAVHGVLQDLALE